MNKIRPLSRITQREIFQNWFVIALTFVSHSPSVLWLKINSRGKILPAPQSQREVDYKMHLPVRIWAIGSVWLASPDSTGTLQELAPVVGRL